jgi:hypothetical protein
MIAPSFIGDKEIADPGGFGHRHHPVAVHHGFQGGHRVDLGDDDIGTHAARAAGQPAPAPTVAGDDEVLACQQHVGGAHDAVDGRLPGAVAVIEEVFGHRVVDRDDREVQRPVGSHGAQADDAGGGFLGAANDPRQQLAAVLVQHADQVGAVVHGDLRLVVQRRRQVLVVGDIVLALDGEDRHFVVLDERSGHIILGGERVGGGQDNIRAAGLQGLHQVGGLAGDVQTGRNAQALQRLFALEAFADLAQDGHFALRPLDTQAAAFGQRAIFDVKLGHGNLLVLSGIESRE